MRHNTIFAINAQLQLLPEPCSGNNQNRTILTREVTLPITCDLLKEVAESGTLTFENRSFRIDDLKTVNAFRLSCNAMGYLGFEDQRDEAVMTALIYSGWKIADPTDARRHKYAIPEELLAQFEALQTQPA